MFPKSLMISPLEWLGIGPIYGERQLIVFQFSQTSGYMSKFNTSNGDEDEGYDPNEELELPTASILKYPVHQEDFYPVDEDGVHEDEIGEEVDDSLKPMYVKLEEQGSIYRLF